MKRERRPRSMLRPSPEVERRRIYPKPYLWWEPPELPISFRKPSIRKRRHPLEESEILDGRSFQVPRLGFLPASKWVKYYYLFCVDKGYLTELYPLRSVAKRYGLNSETMIYWRRYILPPPFELRNERNIKTLFWSRIQLSAVDYTLRYLQKNGVYTIRRNWDDVLDMMNKGCDTLEKYHVRKEEMSQHRAYYGKFRARRLSD